jgi:hypothetical protein
MEKKLIIEKLESSSFSKQHIPLWMKVLDSVPESALGDILAFLNSKDDAAEFLTKNLLKKEQALNNSDLRQWAEAIQEDVEMIKTA